MTTATTPSTQHTNSSSLARLIQNEQNLEVQVKNERMTFEFIKNLEDFSQDEVDSIYSDLSEEEIGKIRSLSRLSNLSENETLNKVMFNKAKKMSPKEAGTYSFRKSIEQFHYKYAGTSNLSVAVQIMLEKYPNGIETSENSKLSHQEAFNMLLYMVNSSKKEMETTQGELQEINTRYYNEYTELLDLYRNELKRTLIGTI